MTTIKPPNDFHAGSDAVAFRIQLRSAIIDSEEVCLDLSEVTFMDSFTFRIVFDAKSELKHIIPPKSDHVNRMYDLWVESKKGLSK